MFKKLLIANRGEIAVRIIRAAHELNIQTIAVYSKADQDALHVQLADQAICVGGAKSSESYLNMSNILSAALESGAEAIHPGFGFLSENSEFSRRCQEAGVKFIGPAANIIDDMGDKANARKLMIEADVTVVPGSDGVLTDLNHTKQLAGEMGYPVIVKASAGGGGRGMRIAYDEEQLISGYNQAKLEAKNAFGDDTMYMEKYVENPKHVEIQIIADEHGNIVTLGERDCSLQRRNQKMIEESPCPVLTDEVRLKMSAEAKRAAAYVGYENAGTIEFLLDKDLNFYFIEMNTRIQVEHPVTEMVTGIDLIKEQIKVACGHKLSFTQEEIEFKGHSIECRINAEDPDRKFMPSPGKIDFLNLPGGNGVRVDTAIYQGYSIPPTYDSMIAKLIVHGETRESAISKMKQALSEMVIGGRIKTNIKFQCELLDHNEFEDGSFDTGFMKKYYEDKL